MELEMKGMKVGLKDCRIWGVHLILMIISLNLVLSEAATATATLVSSIQSGRRLLQTQYTSDTTYQPDGTAMIDPLDHFKKYRGGYDITNKHYWSSTIFTGIYGYAIALLWLITGAVYSIYLLVTAPCCRNKNRKARKRIPCHKQCHLSHLILTTVFAILAIIASGVALEGTMRFHSRAKAVLGIIINTAEHATNTIYNATRAMKEISTTLRTEDADGASDASSFLVSTSYKLDYEAADIDRQAQKNRRLAGKGLTILYILTTITLTLNLVAVIALSVFRILRFRRVFHLLIILCWLLTVACWLFFGAYFFLEKFSADTCSALQDFQQNPDNSSLSTILPCDELLSAKSILSDIGVGIYDIVDQVNANISLLLSSSIPDLEYVCNPFSGPPDYLYQPEQCSSDTIKIRDIPQVLKMFTCSDTSETSCKQGVFITTSEYNNIQAYATSIQNLLDAYPDMESLVDCEVVKNAFSDILLNQCKPLKRDIKTIWFAMLLLSVVMVVLVLLWVTTTHHEQKQHYIDGSVKPNTTEANNPDPEAAKATSDYQVQRPY